MSKSLSLLAGAALAVAISAPAFAATDQEFLSKAIKGDIAEVELGNLALNKSATPDLKSFADTLVTDHTAAKEQASAVAKQVGLAPPAEPTQEEQATYDKLRALNGSEFKREFVADMVKDHEKAIAEYKQEANGKGPVAKLAAETLPTLEKHLKMAEALEGKS